MKLGMISLGCPKNLVDSEVMLGLVQQAGHELTRDAAEADVLVVNTCAFIDTAKQESIDAILEMAAHKTSGSCRRLIVAGCLAERYRSELLEQIPQIDAVLGTGEVPQILSVVGDHAPRDQGSGLGDQGSHTLSFFRSNGEPLIPNPGSPVPTARPLPTYLYRGDTPRLLATPRHYAYLKVAEGCDYSCAFCIIPTLRGKYRSRPADSVIREAENLASQGVKELVLISQDTSFYGNDRGDRGTLAGLLSRLNRVDGLEWIRLLYLYPTTIGDDLLEAIAENDKVCNYIDLPLQHASDPVLARMRRPGTRARYESLLERIRRRIPGVSLRTTLIVGFPGETDADYEQLRSFVEEAQFDHLGVFTYSHEEGTSAHRLVDDVPARVKRRRQAHLMRLQRRIATHRQRARIGDRVRLLVDGPGAEHALVVRARTAGQAPDIDSVVYVTECDPNDLVPGTLVDATIVDSREYDLLARPL